MPLHVQLYSLYPSQNQVAGCDYQTQCNQQSTSVKLNHVTLKTKLQTYAGVLYNMLHLYSVNSQYEHNKIELDHVNS